jgi:hypothetical protein
LVNRLLEGPSAALAPGVRNPLSGVQLRNAVTVTGGTAVVDLTALAADPAPLLSQICAQLVWTLTTPQLRISSVEVRVDGEVVVLPDIPIKQTADDWASFNPDAVPVDAVGHYLSAGALHTATTGTPTPGPAGSGAYALDSAAVSAEPRTGKLTTLAGVRLGPGGATLLIGAYDGDLAIALTAGSLTAPTVAATRSEFWVVRDGTSVVRVPAGAPPQAVSATTLPGLGVAKVLRLSPDGVRAALVIDGPGGPALYVTTVVRAEDGSVGLRDLRPIAPTLSRVVDVAWRDSGELLVLAQNGGEAGNAPYSVGVDGWGLSALPTAGLPSQAASIAAAPTRQPLVSAGGTIWQLNGGTWGTLIRGREPLPGINPFYPL